ncbi:NB-ARC domain-containing protein [Actinophytocola oryzae]|uniref:NB-ARC domain-containing protein n=1 Tax=Actinophytocola oryzae TaxID=502181 RepID=A0A4R7V4C5_9PSEU|nr:NB-ARC domain-containing protein [Actinophytocola oryzae]TDV44278.1 NB-ARC domain-containing protein [Actinophytocola oryzae]
MRSDGVDEVPHQLAPWPGRFVNRERELAVVSGLVAGEGRSGTRIAVFTGLPGVGKTVLVRKAVERHRDAFPGGELLVEFARTEDGGVSVSDALASCLFALGVSASVLPAAEHDRVRLFRTRTASRPVLMVLDDVAEPSEVTPLVPSAPGSVVLVTSTARLTELRLDGAEVVDVAPLDEAAGVALLRELCGERLDEEPVAARQLVALCDGLPVSLRAAAGRLIRRGGLTVTELVADIEDERREGSSAKETAVFSLIYRQLPGDVAAMYRVLGVLPGPDVALGLAAVAGGVTERVAARLLEDLVEAGLVQERDGGRFALPGVVRRHAEERAFAEDTADERTAAVHRTMAELLVLAAFADRAVLGEGRYRCTPHARLLAGRQDPFPGPQGRRQALRWLEAERGLLGAGVRLCAEHEWHELTWQLAEAATALYVTRRYLLDWTETSDRGARAAALAGHAAAEARLRSFVSRPWTDLGDLPRARREVDAAFALADRLSDPRLMASIHEMDGRLRDAEGDPASAVVAFGRALELFRTEGDLRGEAFVGVFVGNAQLGAGEPSAAVATLNSTLGLVERVGDPRMVGRAMTGLARAHLATTDVPAARSWFERAITVLRDSGDAVHEAHAQQLLADLLADDGDVRGARECLVRARDLHLGLGSGAVDELERRLTDLGPA